MTKIIFIDHSGERRETIAEDGSSVMAAAIASGIPGIDADCGGACACATCHVIVNPQWIDKTGVRNQEENAMLEFVPDITETSRLACQIKVSPELEGLIITTPEYQF